ncbi:hypothetical protein EBR57_10430, partial [bacterium]|nr:hypothetical protein [bacterium]
MVFAKPESVGMRGVRRFDNPTVHAREMTFDNLYTPPSGNLNVSPENVYPTKPVKDDEIPL